MKYDDEEHHLFHIRYMQSLFFARIIYVHLPTIQDANEFMKNLSPLAQNNQQLDFPHNISNPNLMMMKNDKINNINDIDINKISKNDKIKIDNSDLKEKNKIAAKKWRKKKENYLKKLEEVNDLLRNEVVKLYYQSKSLKVEINVFETELWFFQSVITTIVNHRET